MLSTHHRQMTVDALVSLQELGLATGTRALSQRDHASDEICGGPQ